MKETFKFIGEYPLASICFMVAILFAILLGLKVVYDRSSQPSDITLTNPDIIVMDRPLADMPDEYLQENIDRLYKSISTDKHTPDSVYKASALIAVYQNELILRELRKVDETH